MSTIQNPVIKGFFPDPSFLRVGDDYYIANSTFEWFPGVPIHHSRDLVHWQFIDHGLKKRSQLELAGAPDSGGIWAPSLSWDKGVFYLVYTIVWTCGMGRPFKDHHNYLVTANSIHGPWSEPVFLNSSGFDPSLFHDDDGRKWVVNLQWDFRKGHSRFDGIVLQEYDASTRRLTGPIRNILRKKELIEGPNLYKRDGWYYLMLAEGGTGWNHSISMARARSIEGPYEVDPQPVILTARDDEGIELQKAGHGELVQTPSGDWFLAHLCGRPVGKDRRCILGRETAIQRVKWSGDGWLRLDAGGTRPQLSVPGPPELSPHAWPVASARDDFDSESLGVDWSSLRVPSDESWVTLRERPGFLRLRGRESLFSLHEQSFVAKRIQSFRCTVETVIEFEPCHFTQTAGLVFYYDTKGHYYLQVTHLETEGRILQVVLTDNGAYDELTDSRIAIGEWSRCYLRGVLDFESLQFFASPDGMQWQSIGPVLDATKLSDDYGQALRFTGTFAGVCAQDLGGTRTAADFDYFEMKPEV